MIKPTASFATIRHDSPALARAVKRLRDAYVANGVLTGMGSHPESPGVPMANVAAYNELGTRHSPSRPFMRTAYLRLFGKHRAQIAGAMRAALTGGGRVLRTPKIEQFYGVCGELLKTKMRENIRHARLLFAPNSETTVALKGSAQPLFDTGQLLKSLSYDVRQKGGSK